MLISLNTPTVVPSIAGDWQALGAITPAQFLITSSADCNPAAYIPVATFPKRVFQEFLALEVEPGCTVADIGRAMSLLCAADCPPSDKLQQLLHMQRAAGIYYLAVNEHQLGGITIDNPEALSRKFPHFKHNMPFIAKCGGVLISEMAQTIKHSGLQAKPRAVNCCQGS